MQREVETELQKFTKYPPKTNAEKQFHKWLLEWKAKIATSQNKGAA